MTETTSTLVAQRIITMRKARGWTQADLASRCFDAGEPQLTAAVLANIESGRPDGNGRRRREVSIDELIALAAIFEVDPYQVLSDINVGPSKVTDLTLWITTIQGVPMLCQTCGAVTALSPHGAASVDLDQLYCRDGHRGKSIPMAFKLKGAS